MGRLIREFIRYLNYFLRTIKPNVFTFKKKKWFNIGWINTIFSIPPKWPQAVSWLSITHQISFQNSHLKISSVPRVGLHGLLELDGSPRRCVWSTNAKRWWPRTTSYDTDRIRFTEDQSIMIGKFTSLKHKVVSSMTLRFWQTDVRLMKIFSKIMGIFGRWKVKWIFGIRLVYTSPPKIIFSNIQVIQLL